MLYYIIELMFAKDCWDTSWDDVSADIKKNLIVSLSIIKIISKPK